jgi:hypothetical protein
MRRQRQGAETDARSPDQCGGKSQNGGEQLLQQRQNQHQLQHWIGEQHQLRTPSPDQTEAPRRRNVTWMSAAARPWSSFLGCGQLSVRSRSCEPCHPRLLVPETVHLRPRAPPHLRVSRGAGCSAPGGDGGGPGAGAGQNGARAALSLRGKSFVQCLNCRRAHNFLSLTVFGTKYCW